MDGNELFLYAEIDSDMARTGRTSEGKAINDRWQEYMSDILIRDLDPNTGEPYWLEEVFHLD